MRSFPKAGEALTAFALIDPASVLRHLGRSEKAECLEQRIPDLKVQEISLSPGQELVAVITQSQSESGDGEVRMELDAVNLPDEVYAQFDLDSLEKALERALGGEAVGSAVDTSRVL
jgi:replication initiation and membrane attachment protein DnaB